MQSKSYFIILRGCWQGFFCINSIDLIYRRIRSSAFSIFQKPFAAYDVPDDYNWIILAFPIQRKLLYSGILGILDLVGQSIIGAAVHLHPSSSVYTHPNCRASWLLPRETPSSCPGPFVQKTCHHTATMQRHNLPVASQCNTQL